jgi:Flp pilus assembly protein TadD
VRARLGVALLKNGDVELARSEFMRALAMDPEQAIARRNLAALEHGAAGS